MGEVLRYLGIAKETVYGTKVPAVFHIDQSSSDINPPDGAELIKPGGLGRIARFHSPGMYIPAGTVEFVADPPLLYYPLWILLGDKTTVDNTSTTTDEATPSDGNGDINATLVNLPVVPGTVIIEDSGAVQHGHDDGYGNIVADAPGTLAGTINYSTGVMKVTGGTVSEAYTTTYDHGTFEHTIKSDNDQIIPSATFQMGKDLFQHTFLGVGINQLTLAVEKEWANVTLDVMAQKDENEAIVALSNLKIPQGYPLPFHKVGIQQADYGGSLADYCAKVEGLSLVIGNNADAEGGVTLCNRHPQKIYGGDLEITMDLTLNFADIVELQDFWGAASGPDPDGTKEKMYKISLSGGNIGTVDFNIHRAIMTSPPTISPSGRERITQSFSIMALHDAVNDEAVNAVCTSIYNYS